MGLYSSICLECKMPFMWFSGNLDQRCDDCRNPKDKKVENMDYQQAHLDSLNKVISVQNELISFLKAEIERLKLNGLYINAPNTIQVPGIVNPSWFPPNPQPFIQPPYVNPPINPLPDPYYTTITTSGNDNTITSIGDPPGTVGQGCTNIAAKNSNLPFPDVKWPEAPESIRPKKKK